MLTVFPQEVKADATALVIFTGPPFVSVSWSLTGSGALTPNSTMTDAAGTASAVYTPGAPGDHPVVEVTHGL